MHLSKCRILDILKIRMILLKTTLFYPKHTPCVMVLKYVHRFFDTLPFKRWRLILRPLSVEWLSALRLKIILYGGSDSVPLLRLRSFFPVIILPYFHIWGNLLRSGVFSALLSPFSSLNHCPSHLKALQNREPVEAFRLGHHISLGRMKQEHYEAPSSVLWTPVQSTGVREIGKAAWADGNLLF